MATPGRPDDRSMAREAGQYLGVGIQFAGAIVLFLFVGQWLDRQLGTEPWLLLLGVFVGAGAGFYSLYRQLVIAPRERERRRRGE
jgi:ATP synthase protein I